MRIPLSVSSYFQPKAVDFYLICSGIGNSDLRTNPMWHQVLVYNILILFGLGALGFLPSRLIERKIGTITVLTRVFIALICGYFCFETLVAIAVTRGITVHWLNFLPFGILWFLPDSTHKSIEHKPGLAFGLVPVFIFAFACWYFLKSYAWDLQNLDRYPFIDIVSYASISFGMKLSGIETILFDSAIYYPETMKFSLYHFTELWFTVGLVKMFDITELFAVSFLAPVFLITLIGVGLTAIGSGFKIPVYAFGILILALCFANAKLILGNDIFLYNILDLCGLKLSLIIPVLIFLFILRHKLPVLFAFALLLPQVNILLGGLLSVGVGLYFFYNLKRIKSAFHLANWIGFGLYGLVILVVLLNPGESASTGPPIGQFSSLKALLSIFTYFREAIFNLGINYWAPFIVVSALLISGKNGLLLLPFVVAKGTSFVLIRLLHFDPVYNSIPEVFLFFGSLYSLNRYFKIYDKQVDLTILVLFCLCILGGIGLAMTGFMDFEQIYTLYAGSLFFILTFFLFQKQESNRGIVEYLGLEKFKWVLGSFLLAAITLFTFRFQRVLPFDQPFYKSVSKSMASLPGEKYSAYFSTKPFYPFPLHVQAGFPLLFEYSSAISTPVTMFEDSSWLGTERVAHVQSFPYARFARNDSVFQQDNNLINLQKRFLKQFKIQYLWFDKTYPEAKKMAFEPAVLQKFKSEQDQIEFWVMDLDKL